MLVGEVPGDVYIGHVYVYVPPYICMICLWMSQKHPIILLLCKDHILMMGEKALPPHDLDRAHILI